MQIKIKSKWKSDLDLGLADDGGRGGGHLLAARAGAAIGADGASWGLAGRHP